MPALPQRLTISELATRSGVAASALRFYESRGLIWSERTPGNQRRFPREMLRRVAVIRAGVATGLTLDQVRGALGTLPRNRTPGPGDWAEMSRYWRSLLDERIQLLSRLRDTLAGCIGCGCLSLTNCGLLNPGDKVAKTGAGPRILVDRLSEFV